VRRNSWGFQQWVFAVTNSSGARLPIAAIIGRLNASVRSAANVAGLAAVTMDDWDGETRPMCRAEQLAKPYPDKGATSGSRTGDRNLGVVLTDDTIPRQGPPS
jgi:hypothetical protein